MRRVIILKIIILTSLAFYSGCIANVEEIKPILPLVEELDSYIGDDFNNVQNRIIRQGFKKTFSNDTFSMYGKINEDGDSIHYGIQYRNFVVEMSHYIISGRHKFSLRKLKALELGDAYERFLRKENFKYGACRFSSHIDSIYYDRKEYFDTVKSGAIYSCYEIWEKNSKQYCCEFISEGEIIELEIKSLE